MLIIIAKSNDVSHQDGFALVSGRFTSLFSDKVGCDVLSPVNGDVSGCSGLIGESAHSAG